MNRDERIILEAEKLRLESQRLIARCALAKDDLDQEIIISESLCRAHRRKRRAEKLKHPDRF